MENSVDSAATAAATFLLSLLGLPLTLDSLSGCSLIFPLVSSPGIDRRSNFGDLFSLFLSLPLLVTVKWCVCVCTLYTGTQREGKGFH